MRRLVLAFAVMAASSAPAQEPSAPDDRPRPHGTITHGDSGDILEEFFGGSVERQEPEDKTPVRKHDPGIRWQGPAGAR